MDKKQVFNFIRNLCTQHECLSTLEKSQVTSFLSHIKAFKRFCKGKDEFYTSEQIESIIKNIIQNYELAPGHILVECDHTGKCIYRQSAYATKRYRNAGIDWKFSCDAPSLYELRLKFVAMLFITIKMNSISKRIIDKSFIPEHKILR